MSDSPGPARQRLAAAIERRDQALGHLAKINRAIAASPDPIDLLGEVDAASEALKQARAREPELVLARALNEALGHGDSVDTCERRLATAQSALEEARETRAILASSADLARERLDLATTQLGNAVAEVLREASETAALYAAWKATHRWAEVLPAALRAVGPGGLPLNWDATPYVWNPEADRDPFVLAWREAIKALKNDPHAALPAAP